MKHYTWLTQKGDFENVYIPAERKTRSDSKKIRAINNKTIFTFDIETTSFVTNDVKMSYCYIWQCCINGHVYYGRYLHEFVEVLDKLTNDNWIQICWVHNLGYEFQFLRNIIEFDKVFARTNRKPIFARYKNIEFRCTYFLSNMSLSALAKSYDLPHKKMEGDINYTLPRNSKTPLSYTEERYCENDVLVLYDYINYLMKNNGRNMKKIPYTQTGFMRGALLQYAKDKKEYYALRKLVTRIAPDMNVFLLLERAFMGGITHASFTAVLEGIIEDVDSYDRRSSYPAVMCSCKYPMTKFVKIATNYNNYIHNSDFAFVTTVVFRNIESKYDMCTFSKHKCIKIVTAKDEDGHTIIPDSNGRIWKAAEIEVTITDIDFYNIEKMYKFDDFEIKEMWVSRYGYLPKVIVEFVLTHYGNKTKLKNVQGMEDLYMWSKQYINSTFGDMVLNPFCDDIEFSNDDGWSVVNATPEKLQKYYDNPKTIKVYQWGVWITAHARAALIDAIVKVKDDCKYSDTDSVKCTGEHTDTFAELNRAIQELNKQAAEHFNLSYDLWKPKSPDGEEQELGTWDYEGTYEKFKALGAKRYAVIQNGKCHATVAGSPKGAIEEKINGNLDLFEDGLFLSGEYDKDGNNESHKICMTYIDNLNKTVSLVDYTGQPETVHIGHCIHAAGASFEMGRTPTYRDFLAINNKNKVKIRNGVYQ